MVVLAVPYAAVHDIVAERGNQLAGKIVVDVTNPVDFETAANGLVERSFWLCPRQDSNLRHPL